MPSKGLTVTISSQPRPWWRPLSLRSFRRWYREGRRKHRYGRLLSLACAFVVARQEFSVGGRKLGAL